MTVSGQWLSKHVPVAVNTHAAIELVLEKGCVLCEPCQDVISKGQSQFSSVHEAVKIGPEHMKLKNLYCYKVLPGNSW
jgi:hypothetical protein